MPSIIRPADLDRFLAGLEQPLPIYAGPAIAKARAALAETVKRGLADVERAILLDVKLSQQRLAKEERLDAMPDGDAAARARLDLELGLPDLEIERSDLERHLRTQADREQRALKASQAAWLDGYYAFIERNAPIFREEVEAMVKKPLEHWPPHLEKLQLIAGVKEEFRLAVYGFPAYREPPNGILMPWALSSPLSAHAALCKMPAYARRLRAVIPSYTHNQVAP